ncbi:formyl-coenzyme A transferase [Variibacter gotjawalensis]|uniref:Formyl-coenzyme A transferase n=1 Tax=Variibacter gotjawalensis TaxID=1333996 RepID=A0A0S3PUN9_9BRAD|nr:CoA transferase [Variibacter gotjawalensis]NIK49914.1 CoA:oxalate CoA-transferase [Variibacter gotjawalensis]RZS45913.1 crotonobetainyl-CoA:carnitine CoA-transferase CaiB-like acyl-CoA transferase [Variibacter gotjawalensis]BAT59588.1 formyl-coenzyme A transferase [Variibacter gotjawalensis]
MTLPMLEGIRVIDITQFVAGPVCSRLLADAGADVIKIELAPYGDRSRVQGFKPREAAYQRSSRSTYFFQHNHSKRSLALDFKHESGRKILRELIAKADVLVENFAPGVMARAGLSFEDMSKINPRLIMCSVSFAGQTGPLSTKPGYDYIAQAYSGVTSLIGEPDRSPSQMPIAIGDVSTGVSAAMAVGFALFHRERTGRGQHVEATLLDTYFHMHEANVPKVAIRGEKFAVERTGSQHPDGGPIGLFRCGDDTFISINVLSHQFAQFAKTIGRPELAEDPRYATAHGRRDNNADLVVIIEQWLATFPTRDEAMQVLDRERIPCAPVLTLHEAMRQPHLLDRGTVRKVHDDQIGDFLIPGAPARFSEWPQPEGLRVDMLGENNETVLKELGYSATDIAALYNDKVIVRDKLLETGDSVKSQERKTA